MLFLRQNPLAQQTIAERFWGCWFFVTWHTKPYILSEFFWFLHLSPRLLCRIYAQEWLEYAEYRPGVCMLSIYELFIGRKTCYFLLIAPGDQNSCFTFIFILYIRPLSRSVVDEPIFFLSLIIIILIMLRINRSCLTRLVINNYLLVGQFFAYFLLNIV